MKISREKIDLAGDGELTELARLHIGGEGLPVALDGNGCFAVAQACGLRGWELTMIHRAGFGVVSVAALCFDPPGGQAAIAVRHARPEVAAFRAFLYATACEEGPKQ